MVSPTASPAAPMSRNSASSLPIAPVIWSPSATMHAPVSVAVSMITFGFFSARYASASASTSRPSASVFSTSDVVPPRCVSTSPGFVAEPLGMFSDDGIAAITLIFGLRSAITLMVARIDAAPPMSHFIVSMPLASLIDRPPESNAMPLPVSAIGVSRAGAPVPELDQARRVHAAGADAEDAAEPALLQLGLAPDLAAEPDLARHLLRLARDLRGRHVAGRRVHQVARPADGLGDDLPALDGLARRLRVGPRRAEHRDPGERLRLGLRGLVAIEAVARRAPGPRPSPAPRRRRPARRPPAGTWSRRSRSAANALAARPSTRRTTFGVSSALSPTPTSRTAPAANRSPSRRTTSRFSCFLPVSLASRYACSRPTSFTPGPGSGPLGPWNIGSTSTPVRTFAGESVEYEHVVTEAPSRVRLASGGRAAVSLAGGATTHTTGPAIAAGRYPVAR